MRQAQKLGFFLSFSFLIIVIIEWSNLFFFSKTVQLPEWSNYLPAPINLPRYLAFICLIPFLLTHNIHNYKKSLILIVLLSPIPALIFYVFDQIATNNKDIYLNAAFNYVWLTIWNLMIPAMVVILCLHIKSILEKLCIKKGRTRRPLAKR